MRHSYLRNTVLVAFGLASPAPIAYGQSPSYPARVLVEAGGYVLSSGTAGAIGIEVEFAAERRFRPFVGGMFGRESLFVAEAGTAFEFAPNWSAGLAVAMVSGLTFGAAPRISYEFDLPQFGLRFDARTLFPQRTAAFVVSASIPRKSK